MWAVAEVSWQDQSGQPVQAPATLEDTSRSGACVRLKAAIEIGSRVHIKWQREQFSAIARNCRQDGRDFLLGVRREPGAVDPATGQRAGNVPARSSPETPDKNGTPLKLSNVPQSHKAPPAQPLASSFADERKSMEPKALFPKLWARQPASDAPAKLKSPETPMNKPNTPAPQESTSRTDLLSYEDIYRAAGILAPPSGYGIQKVVDMLNSDRLRDLSKEIKRVSVLMALDAAGTSVDDLLQDATRRQRALDSYEAGRRRELEEFETRKSQENAQIEAELERLKAHYAERIQRNREQVDREKEAVRNWQMAMQHEVQRITEVMELCRKPAAAAAGAGSSSPQSAIKCTNDPVSS
jgi:hypothetical protein